MVTEKTNASMSSSIPRLQSHAQVSRLPHQLRVPHQLQHQRRHRLPHPPPALRAHLIQMPTAAARASPTRMSIAAFATKPITHVHRDVFGLNTSAAVTTSPDLVGPLLLHPRPQRIRTAPRLDGMATARRGRSRTDLDGVARHQVVALSHQQKTC